MKDIIKIYNPLIKFSKFIFNKKISTERESLSTLELVNRSVLVGKVGFRSNAIIRVKK